MAPRHAATMAVMFTLAPGALADCSCKFQGEDLASNIIDGYPNSNPGQYSNLTGVAKYGTMCAAWDTMPGTPYHSSCDAGTNFSDPANGWCQAPWCYVDSTCASAVASDVFAGSDVAHYSYDACGAPNCYGDQGADGCPYDRVYKDDCACKYHGDTLPSALISNYPASEPGKYENDAHIEYYGTTCAAWDQSPNTPFSSSCPDGADWCTYGYNWCQAPWCYVDAACSTRVVSEVFSGSGAAAYSYDTCRTTPDCFTNTGEDDREDLPADCPFDGSSNDWATGASCSGGWVDAASRTTSGCELAFAAGALAFAVFAA